MHQLTIKVRRIDKSKYFQYLPIDTCDSISTHGVKNASTSMNLATISWILVLFIIFYLNLLNNLKHNRVTSFPTADDIDH